MTISEQWAELLEPGLRSIFFKQTNALAASAKAPILFNVQGSSKATEHLLGAGGFGDWKEYKGAIEYDNFDQGYKTSLTHSQFARGFEVERFLVETDQYNIINARPAGLALAGVRKREKDAASVFNNAFDATNYAHATEGQSLCDGAHPASPANTATTQSNSGTTALSKDAISATRLLMREYKDDRGELIQVMPDVLLVPPELEETAYVAVGTEKKPGSADNDLNFVNAMGLRVVVWDYLTDANNWFLVDSRLAKQHLWWFDLTNMEFALNPASDYQLKAQYRGYMAYAYGWSDWVWIYGHSVT